MDWLELHQGTAPLLVAFPHGGTDLAGLDGQFASPWLARKDTDWHIAEIYAGARALGASTLATRISRSVIDCNRDPAGASLYPGRATTGLCPETTFDGELLYRGARPDPAEIARRRASWFAPYHAALAAELKRLRARHPQVVLYDAHSIRSRVPRLFDGELPQFNLGTNDGASCAPELAAALAATCDRSGFGWVADGRFKGGWTTRHYGDPATGIHAVQMELAMRGYLTEPAHPDPSNWPAAPHPDPAIAPVLRQALADCLAFAKGTC